MRKIARPFFLQKRNIREKVTQTVIQDILTHFPNFTNLLMCQGIAYIINSNINGFLYCFAFISKRSLYTYKDLSNAQRHKHNNTNHNDDNDNY